MKKRIIAVVLLLAALLSLCSCAKESSFQIRFIDVGQGDAALVECDGEYMLIDGGDTSAGDKVYEVLQTEGVKKLKYLVISHLHKDHYGGLTKALTCLKGKNAIGKTLCNAKDADEESYLKFERELFRHCSKITIPKVGEKPFKLGSAEIEVLDNCAEDSNDSLVLLITYKKTKFLFTGDIEDAAQKRICNKYPRESLTEVPYKIDLMKLPHHGSFTNTLQTFLETFMPDYVVISVGAGNRYGHPDEETLDKLDNKTWKPEIYRTDYHGDIIVISNGESLQIRTA